MALSLLALDYEHDAYQTPRVVAGLDEEGRGYLGIVAENKLVVREVRACPGEAQLIATYELTDPTPIELAGEDPETLCASLYACEYEHPVAALVVMPLEGGVRMAVRPRY
jgi:IMP cyclohydrolase